MDGPVDQSINISIDFYISIQIANIETAGVEPHRVRHGQNPDGRITANPVERMKSGEPHRVPLPAAALDIVHKTPKEKKQHDMPVFPSRVKRH